MYIGRLGSRESCIRFPLDKLTAFGDGSRLAREEGVLKGNTAFAKDRMEICMRLYSGLI